MENKNLISQRWPAPAKLNLFLHVVGRREDGYHLLQTVFQFIDYCDYLDFEITGNSDITLAGNDGIQPVEKDLIFRAAKLLQDETGCRQGARITIDKKIPVGGGLGGGSSNAATTLAALNHLWQPGLRREQLAALGLRLGADVPVFIHGRAAFAEGVGEQLTAIEPDEPWYLVIYPGCEVATAAIFNAADLTRNTPPITIRDFLKDGGHNDCEAPVRQRYPQVAAALDWLQTYARATMTGTGSCIFASFNDRTEAETVCRKLPDAWQGIVARGTNQSPLMARLEQATC